MPIGNIIREKRKEKGYTQEQVADYLGVSAPAVNKWEKGTSYPDISLLSPIARLLETDLNTLLCFEEEMTEKEMDTFCNQMMEEIQKNGFKRGFLMGEEKIRNYPNCGAFIQKIAVLLDGARLIYGLSDPMEDQHYYEERIEKFYERASRVGEGEAKAAASFMLASKYMAGERYEEARELLETLPNRSSIDKRQIETQILIREERYEEAKKLLERRLLQQVTETQGILWNLQEVEIRQRDHEAASHLADVAGAYGKLMELWDYNQYVAPFQSAMSARDTDECLKLLEQMLEAALNIWDIRDTFLYRDLAGNTSQEEEKEQERKKSAGKQIAQTLLSMIERDPQCEFLKDNEKVKCLQEKYQKKLKKM